MCTRGECVNVILSRVFTTVHVCVCWLFYVLPGGTLHDDDYDDGTATLGGRGPPPPPPLRASGTILRPGSDHIFASPALRRRPITVNKKKKKTVFTRR